LNTEIMSAQFTRPLPSPASSSVALVHTSGATQAAQAASPPKKSARAAAWIALVVLLLVVAGLGGRWWWTEYGPGSYLTMPETTGRTLTDVQADLDALGLHTQVEEEFSDDIDTGSVTRSDPEGGSSVHKRAEVQLYVSKGVDMKTVPEVTGKSQDEAQRSLTDAGLAVGAVTDAYSEDVPQGQVISQSVAAGTSLAHDSAVDIVLSKGREPLTVPTLSGLSASAAKSAIEDLGLVAAPTEAYSDTVAEGQVISQQTREGSTLHRGDSVAYTVSKGPEKVAIPDVVGLQREEARSLLEGAGFTVKEEAILGGFFGTVRSSDPAAGTMTKKGSTVTITIV
jgi:serine/threonine-protein kinase PK-1